MKLSRKEVPIYGQAKVFALISSVQEEEVFVVLEGSTLLHVLQTRVHSMLYFIVPGHNQPETVCVRAYTCADDTVLCVGVSYLTYVEDDAQELAEYLVTHSDCLSTTEHRELIGRYGLNDNSVQVQMDERVTLALANLHLPHNLLGQSAQESLLHVCVRLGFMNVVEFLLCQPGALMAINAPNQEGDTPLQLAQQTNQNSLIKLLKHPPNPLATPLAGVSQVWAGRSHLLRFSHASGMLSLSVCLSECMSTPQTLRSAILLLRECVVDAELLNKIKALRVSTEKMAERNTLFSYTGSPYSLLHSVWFNSSSQDEDEDLLSSDDSDGPTTHTDSTSASLTGSSITITASVNTLQDGEDQDIYHQDSLDSQSDSESTASEQDSPVPDRSAVCSPKAELFPSNPEDPIINIERTQCSKSEEEERDKFIPPSKTETEKYKVSRTLSFLRSRMVNTKIKNKVNAEVCSALHQLCSVTALTAACEVCEKADSDELHQCTYCSMVIHKTCCDSAPLCLKNPQSAQMKTADSSILLCSSSHSSPSLSLPGDSNIMTHRKRSNSEGCGHDFTLRKSWSLIGHSTRASPTSNSMESSFTRISFDYTAESWSATVDSDFSKKLDKQVVKRQEIIYELMQTEFHHVQTLSVMADVLRRGLLEEVQLEQDVIGQIFPRLDELIALHKNFLFTMETRQWASVDPGKHRNYVIRRIGDILLQQFSGAHAAQMIELYGDFCSRHPEALRIYKQLLQSSRKLQLFLRQQSTNSVIKRREIPEFLLLVTQRITKYPVLLERLLQHTEDGSAERYDIVMALEGLRGVIEDVERRVGEYERAKKLQDIINRLDNKSCTRLKNGEIFSKQDLQKTHRTLTHSAMLACRTTSGRLRDVLALLLTDVLAFLQEKEQKFVFAALEQKPSVMPLRRLIVREIANQERGLFLISSESSAGPEMYEIHTHTREERNTWMSLLRQAAESLPDDQIKKNEGEIIVKKIQKLQEALFSLDLQLCSVIEEKLRICRGTGRWSLATCRLLVQPHPENTPQGITLLSDAQEEVVKLAITLLSWLFPFMWSPSNLDNFGQDRVTNNDEIMPSRTRRCAVVGTGVGPLAVAPISPAHQTYLKVAESVHSLIHILYSLQAAVIIQDSCFEVQKLLLLEGEAPPTTPVSDFDVRKIYNCLDTGGVVGANTAVRQRELEQKEREHTELMDRLMKEKEQFEEELKEFEKMLKDLKEEEKKVEEEREKLREEGKKVMKERKSLEIQLRLIQHNSNNRQMSLPFIVSQEK